MGSQGKGPQVTGNEVRFAGEVKHILKPEYMD